MDQNGVHLELFPEEHDEVFRKMTLVTKVDVTCKNLIVVLSVEISGSVVIIAIVVRNLKNIVSLMVLCGEVNYFMFNESPLVLLVLFVFVIKRVSGILALFMLDWADMIKDEIVFQASIDFAVFGRTCGVH